MPKKKIIYRNQSAGEPVYYYSSAATSRRCAVHRRDDYFYARAYVFYEIVFCYRFGKETLQSGDELFRRHYVHFALWSDSGDKYYFFFFFIPHFLKHTNKRNRACNVREKASVGWLGVTYTENVYARKPFWHARGRESRKTSTAVVPRDTRNLKKKKKKRRTVFRIFKMFITLIKE